MGGQVAMELVAACLRGLSCRDIEVIVMGPTS